jgi:hypothetical protein
VGRDAGTGCTTGEPAVGFRVGVGDEGVGRAGDAAWLAAGRLVAGALPAGREVGLESAPDRRVAGALVAARASLRSRPAGCEAVGLGTALGLVGAAAAGLSPGFRSRPLDPGASRSGLRCPGGVAGSRLDPRALAARSSRGRESGTCSLARTVPSGRQTANSTLTGTSAGRISSCSIGIATRNRSNSQFGCGTMNVRPALTPPSASRYESSDDGIGSFRALTSLTQYRIWSSVTLLMRTVEMNAIDSPPSSLGSRIQSARRNRALGGPHPASAISVAAVHRSRAVPRAE